MTRSLPAFRTSMLRKASICQLIATACALAFNVTFTQPIGGSVHATGEYLRIEFVVDPSANFINQVFGISVDDGLKYAILPGLMDGTDTVSVKHHYDWLIPLSVQDEFGNNNIPNTVSATCRIRMIPYPGGGGNGSGVSDAFSIVLGTATRKPVMPTRARSCAEDFRVIASLANTLPSTAFPENAKIALFGFDGRFRQVLAPAQSRRDAASGGALTILRIQSSDASR